MSHTYMLPLPTNSEPREIGQLNSSTLDLPSSYPSPPPAEMGPSDISRSSVAGVAPSANVVVAVKEERRMSKTSLAWALTHVVRPGDYVTLLTVLAGGGDNKGKKIWSAFPRFGDCGSRQMKENSPEQKNLISETCSQMMMQFHGAYEGSKINLSIKMVSATPVGSVASECKRAGANWVVLDKQLKQEKKRCMEELQCNIVVMKRSKAKILRLNLDCSNDPAINEIPSCSDEEPPEDRIKHSTPISSPETDRKEIYSRLLKNTASTLGGLYLNESPFYALEWGGQTYLNKLGRSFSQEVDHYEDACIGFSSDDEKMSPAPSHPLLDTRSIRRGSSLHHPQSQSMVLSRTIQSPEDNHAVFWIPQNHELVDGNSTIKSTSKKTLIEKFTEFDQVKEALDYSPRTMCGRKEYVFNSDVREAVALCRSSPSLPPPLCSLCQHKSPVLGKPPRWFSYKELEEATNGFSEKNFLAEGGFGLVHKGVLQNGQVVAVKQLKLASAQGDAEFSAEVEVLSCAQHRNVVMLIGFCIEEKRRILVYEYICNGSLDYHLYGRSRTPLDWQARVKVAIGAARGLRYLHEDCRVGCIIHRDMRPNNILVTHDFEPMVGDFGLAKLQADGSLSMETRVVGTFGYLAPEYTQSGRVTEKADVYAFGVVLLELVTGRKAVDINQPRGRQFLTEWARPLLAAHEEGQTMAVDRLVDWRLGHQQIPLVYHQLRAMAHAASLCLQQDPEERPRMSKVLRLLEGDHVVESAFTMDTIGNRSGRMSGVRIQALAEPGRSQSARLSSDTLKEIYVVKERQPMHHTRMFLG